MCPGFTSEDGALDHDLPKGSPVVIGAHGKKHAMAVGQVLMGRDAVREVNKGPASRTPLSGARALAGGEARLTLPFL